MAKQVGNIAITVLHAINIIIIIAVAIYCVFSRFSRVSDVGAITVAVSIYAVVWLTYFALNRNIIMVLSYIIPLMVLVIIGISGFGRRISAAGFFAYRHPIGSYLQSCKKIKYNVDHNVFFCEKLYYGTSLPLDILYDESDQVDKLANEQPVAWGGLLNTLAKNNNGSEIYQLNRIADISKIKTNVIKIGGGFYALNYNIKLD